MTLREEIFGYIVTGHKSYNTALSAINYVMKAIEKRIDETIQDIKRDTEFISKNNMPSNPILTIQLHHIFQLKEMLK